MKKSDRNNPWAPEYRKEPKGGLSYPDPTGSVAVGRVAAGRGEVSSPWT